jgi:hypothetical protein
MAKQGTKVLPARKSAASRDDDSLLNRSAESLGRVIGSLQQQMRGTAKRMSTIAEDAMDALPELPRAGTGTRGTSSKRGASRKTAGARKGQAASKAGGRKGSGRARKSTRSRKTAGRSR